MTGRLCSFCVLDDSMPGTTFDVDGRCNWCRHAEARMCSAWYRGERGLELLDAKIRQVQRDGRHRSYDCLIGLSGGVDSAYLALLLRQRYPDLRILAIHVDGGWNSEPAVRNIELLVRALDLDFHTKVIEWSEMQDLQRAFLRSGVLNQDIPQDHVFFAALYHTAAELEIRWFLSGLNFSSECVNPTWIYPAIDLRHLLDIHRRFGERPLTSFPRFTLAQLVVRKYLLRSLSILAPLNFIDYDRRRAVAELREHVGWRDYGEKHCESRWTKFYQEIYLPVKYRFDKRRMHYSSLIVSGKMTRDEALALLEAPPYDPNKLQHDVRFIAKKLDTTEDELMTIIRAEPTPHSAYASNRWAFDGARVLKARLRRLRSMIKRTRHGA